MARLALLMSSKTIKIERDETNGEDGEYGVHSAACSASSLHPVSASTPAKAFGHSQRSDSILPRNFFRRISTVLPGGRMNGSPSNCAISGLPFPSP